MHQSWKTVPDCRCARWASHMPLCNVSLLKRCISDVFWQDHIQVVAKKSIHLPVLYRMKHNCKAARQVLQSDAQQTLPGLLQTVSSSSCLSIPVSVLAFHQSNWFMGCTFFLHADTKPGVAGNCQLADERANFMCNAIQADGGISAPRQQKLVAAPVCWPCFIPPTYDRGSLLVTHHAGRFAQCVGGSEQGRPVVGLMMSSRGRHSRLPQGICYFDGRPWIS